MLNTNPTSVLLKPQRFDRRSHLRVSTQLHFVSLVHAQRQVENLLLQTAPYPVAIH